jgi:hypothetical protein
MCFSQPCGHRPVESEEEDKPGLSMHLTNDMGWSTGSECMLEMFDSDAPELVALVTELRDGLHELHTKIQPVMDKVWSHQHQAESLGASNKGIHVLGFM